MKSSNFIIIFILLIAVVGGGALLLLQGNRDAREEETPADSTAENEQTMQAQTQTANSKADAYTSVPSEVANAELADGTTQATIVTSKGDILVELYGDIAPKTVSNFLFLSREDFYDNLTFHRVEPGFVIQGGDPLGTGQGGPGYTVEAEISDALKHEKGTLSMARLPDQVNPEKASSGSQFYITLEATPFLDGEYTAFGRVIEGMDIVESIQIGDVIEDVRI